MIGHGVRDSVSAGAALSRRHSLATLGRAALASALLGPRPVRANEAAKKARKRVRNTCKQQDAQCAAFFNNLCEETECEPEAIDAALACCAILRSYDAGKFMACMFDVLTGVEPE